MPINRPSEYQHQNPAYAIVDQNNVRGGLHRVSDIGTTAGDSRDDIPLDKRELNMHVNVAGTIYVYSGVDLLDVTWINVSNWSVFESGGGVESVTADEVYISVDNTDPANPEVGLKEEPVELTTEEITIVEIENAGAEIISSIDTEIGTSWRKEDFPLAVEHVAYQAGIHHFADIAERDALPAVYRTNGMTVSVDGVLYKFSSGTWTDTGNWTTTGAESGIFQETFDTVTEVSATLGYAIMPTIAINPINGWIYSQFEVSSDHNTFSDRISVVRVSKDGGETWTGLDGTGTHTEMDLDGTGTTDQISMSGHAFTPTGRWVIFYRQFSGNTYLTSYSRWSDDGGLTWSTPYDRGALGHYMFDNRFCLDKQGYLMFSQPNGSGVNARRVETYKSKDNGETWSLHSTVYDPQKSNYTMGEPVMRDFGNGLFIIIQRNANGLVTSGTFTGLDLPMLFVSHDYGDTWAGGTETITETQLNNGEFNSGWLPLEGLSVDLGDGTYENCLPLFERVDYEGQSYMIIAYYLRAEISTESRDELLKLTAINMNEWLLKGYKAIKDGVQLTVYEADNILSQSQYDGNGSFLIPNNSIADALWTICDNITASSSGNEVIRTGKIHKGVIKGLVESLYDANTIS